MKQPIEIALLAAAFVLILLMTLLPHVTHEDDDPLPVAAVPFDQPQ